MIFTLDLVLIYTDGVVSIPMGINWAPLVADMFLFCYERNFMTSLSDDNQSDIIEAFNSTSRYLHVDLEWSAKFIYLNCYRIKLILQIPRSSFWIYIYLFRTVLFPPKFIIYAMSLMECLFLNF